MPNAFCVGPYRFPLFWNASNELLSIKERYGVDLYRFGKVLISSNIYLFAIRLEAITIRLEAITIDWRPILPTELGVTPIHRDGRKRVRMSWCMHVTCKASGKH